MTDDNIINFSDHAKSREPLQTQELSMESLMQRLMSMPQNGLMSSLSRAVNDRMQRLMLMLEIGAKASELLSSIGFNPDDFSEDYESVERFLSWEPDDTEPLWNGPFFDWDADDEANTTVRVATTVDIGDEEARGTPITLMMDILKLGENDEAWQRYSDGEWINDGPPAEFFDLMDAFGNDPWDEDFDDEDDEDFDDEDEDEDDEDFRAIRLGGEAAFIHTLAQELLRSRLKGKKIDDEDGDEEDGDVGNGVGPLLLKKLLPRKDDK